jgi:integrase
MPKGIDTPPPGYQSILQTQTPPHDPGLNYFSLNAGLPSTFKLHDLRHSAATFWLAAGSSIYFVQQQLGHASLQSTISIYGHADQASFRDTAEHAAAWWRTA